MSDYIKRSDLERAMYHEAFEKDSDLQKWDSGCWIRYKLFENVIDSIPAADVVERKRGEWIPCSERLPSEPYGCLVTVLDTDPISMDEFENLLPYFVGWDGEQWNDADGMQCPFEVIAWCPLPEPYKEGNDE